jgi:hypothetical protein
MELELPGDKVQHYVKELFIYQKRKGFIPLIPLIQSIRQGKRGAMATYKGAKKGDVTESRKWMPQGQIKYLDKKACTGLETMHLGGAVPFFDSPTASFSLLVKQRCMTT